jgi:HCOMODA/2-hydroxy-3-carboxy-muconic semialdehyde decarboxylase
MAGFLGNGPKIFDPGAEASISSKGYSANFLVNSYDTAQGLTECFAQSGEDEPDGHAAIALQTAHGFTAVGKDLAEVVYRAIYAQENARVLMQAKALYKDEEIRFFYPENVRACSKMNENAARKAFMGWRADLPSRR